MSTPALPAKRLGHEVHAVRIDDDIVALDLAREAYLCLPGGAAAGTPPPTGRSAELADVLAAAGLIAVADPDAPSSYAPPPLPRTDLGVESWDSLSMRDAVDAAQATLDVLLHYRRRSVSQLIAFIERHRPIGPACDAEALDVAGRFERWVVLVPAPAKCLVRSFMLLRYLQRHGHSALWVFGVRTWPFRAHCWVQLGDRVLDDRYERLIPYTPLLAVRG